MNRKTLNDNIKYSRELLSVPEEYNKNTVEKKYNYLRRCWYPVFHNNSSESEFIYNALQTAQDTLHKASSNNLKDDNTKTLKKACESLKNWESKKGCRCDRCEDVNYKSLAFSIPEKELEKEMEADKAMMELITQEGREKQKALKKKERKKKQREKKKEKHNSKENIKINDQYKNDSDSEEGLIKDDITNEENDDDKNDSSSDCDKLIDNSAFVMQSSKRKKKVQKEQAKHSLNNSKSSSTSINKTNSNHSVKSSNTNDGDNEKTREERAQILASKGYLLAEKEQNFEEAINLFKEAINLYDRDCRLYGHRSFCYERLGLYEEAYADAEKALTLNERWEKGYYRKARALTGLKRYEEAVSCYRKHLELDPNSMEGDAELYDVQLVQLQEMGYDKDISERALNKTNDVNAAAHLIQEKIQEPKKTTIQSNETSRYFKDTTEESGRNSVESPSILTDNIWNTNGSSQNGWANNFFDPEDQNSPKNTNNGTENNSYNIHNLWSSKTLFDDLNEMVNDNINAPKRKTMAEVIACTNSDKLQKNSKPVNDTNKNNVKPPCEGLKKPVTNGEVQPSNVPYTTTNKDQLLKDPTNPLRATNLWIGNVAQEVDTDELLEMFGKCGTVISHYRTTEKFYMFVNYQTPEQAAKAMSSYQGVQCGPMRLLLKWPNNVDSHRYQEHIEKGPVNGNECYFWRTTGCKFGADCKFKHIKANKSIDLQGWHLSANGKK
ncbi:DgyrCDS5482 [Dimorphilus gyrociliatus]|uniref:DgyrCDS5482 n=1 Tax=Dimorphilus gyrociliatus TaxID=2664684 RepID=A0A7I8VK15_9ANNE|nr:DgyrCDS5482 [Dimorphilus gyrociliatus]